MKRLLLALILSMTVVSCGPRYVDYFPCHDDGTSKPAVAMLPIVDKTQPCISLSAGEVVSRVIHVEAMNRGELYFINQESMQAASIGTVDFFSNNEEALAKSFEEADFIVVQELVSQEFTPYGHGTAPISCSIICYPCETLLSLKMRIKVIDARPRCPKVVLQEIFHQGFYIPNPANGDAEPIARAYRRFGCNLEQRLEQVIRSAY
jgi:hypothetical protein